MPASVSGPLLRDWLIAMWIAWAALLYGGFILGGPHGEGRRRMPRWARMLATTALVLGAGGWWVVLAGTGDPAAVRYGGWLTLGIVLGLGGDLALARLLRSGQPIVLGILLFGLGHVAYIIAMLSWAGGSQPEAPAGARWLVWLACLMIGAIGWYLVVYRGAQRMPHPARGRHARRLRLHILALPYALLLSSTTGVAAGLALANPGLWSLALGAALFLFSDLLLAARQFAGLQLEAMDIDDLIWLLYSPGQMLIVYSAAVVWMAA